MNDFTRAFLAMQLVPRTAAQHQELRMKRLMPWALPIALLSSYQAHAADRCNWTVGSQPMTITRILSGVMHVPANAEPGSAIGTPNLSSYTQSMPRSELLCFNDGDVLWRFDMNARDVFPDPLPPVEGEPSDGYILKTNIDGVGARIRLRAPFNGAVPTFFMPEGGPHNPFIPMRSTMQAHYQLGGFKLSGITSEVTLVKTGDIAPGQHTIDTELFTGHFDATGLGLVLRYRLQAQVLQTQCALIGDPISDTPVELQTWDKSHFVGKGTTTATVPFSITLSNCKTDPGGLTMATIELEPTKGSTPVQGLDGVFTLTTDSTAEGVGIQVLKDDGTPLPLQREEHLQPIQENTTVLNFGARFYQTDEASAVVAGDAFGALNFTLRYR